MLRLDVLVAYTEYVRMLDAYAAEDVAETKRDDQDAADWHYDTERSIAWSCAFESNEEARLEMEMDDVRCGGTFSELLSDARDHELLVRAERTPYGNTEG